jgi:hypothetical protein
MAWRKKGSSVLKAEEAREQRQLTPGREEEQVFSTGEWNKRGVQCREVWRGLKKGCTRGTITLSVGVYM